MAYHLRVTSSWDLIHTGLITDFLNKFKPHTYVFSEEVSDKGVVHIHGHLEYEKPPASSTMSDLFKRYLLSGKYYHQPLKKEKINNLLYVLKDLNVKLHSLDEHTYTTLVEECEIINEDKKKSTRDKLFQLYRKWFYDERLKCEWITTVMTDLDEELEKVEIVQCKYGCFLDQLTAIALFINDLYINEWKKEPPLAHLNAYVIYIATLMNKEVKHLNTDLTQPYYDIYYFYNKRF